MSAPDVMAERIERGLAMLAPYVEGDGGSMNDPDAFMAAAALIADLLHAVDSLGIDPEEGVDVERVLALARLHYDEESDTVEEAGSEPEPRCDVCNVRDVEASEWCGECGCCRAHCQKFEGCEVSA